MASVLELSIAQGRVRIEHDAEGTAVDASGDLQSVLAGMAEVVAATSACFAAVSGGAGTEVELALRVDPDGVPVIVLDPARAAFRVKITTPAAAPSAPAIPRVAPGDPASSV